MLSVLIPIYNYNVVDLVTAIHKQLIACNIPFEIICLDDASNPEYITENIKIEALPFTTFTKSSENNGRTKTRQLLSDASKYDWLLFLDADTLPTTDRFIINYVAHFNSEVKALFGGISYQEERPDPNYLLRWKYGLKHETNTVENRNTFPFKNIVSANMCMNKNVFNTINSSITYNAYGLDNYFGAKLKELKTSILHINNPVYHLGLESNTIYLKKKEFASDTLLKLIEDNALENNDNEILILYLFLKKTHLNHLFSGLYKVLHIPIKKQLTGNNPSVLLLQCYRIMYMCYSSLNPLKNK